MSTIDVLPRFCAIANGRVERSFHSCFAHPLIPDLAGILSLVSFQYLPFDRTIDRSIRRVSVAEEFSEVTARRVAFRLSSPKHIAERLANILLTELKHALQDVECAVVLLSGGLDSRIIYAAVDRLLRTGDYSGKLLAVTWGKSGSSDLAIARLITARDHVDWAPLSLSESDVITNVAETSRVLGPLLSPVHLHAMPKLRHVIDGKKHVVLAGSLGNGLIEGEYLWRHVSYARFPIPRDWLDLLRPACRADANAELRRMLAEKRAGLRKVHSRVGAYEIEMLSSYHLNLLLLAFDYLRQLGIRTHQAFSGLRFVDEIRSVLPLLRSSRLRRNLLAQLRVDLLNIPIESTTSFHEYGPWTAQNIDYVQELYMAPALRSLGVFSEVGLAAAAKRIIDGGPHATETACVLLWVACLGHFLSREPNARNSSGEFPQPSLVREERRPHQLLPPPWGFASRPYGASWAGVLHRLLQPLGAVGF